MTVYMIARFLYKGVHHGHIYSQLSGHFTTNLAEQEPDRDTELIT